MKTQETVLEVDGMTCPSCIRHIADALQEVEGVAAVEVQMDDGKVRIEHDPAAADAERLVAALGLAGYEARAAA